MKGIIIFLAIMLLTGCSAQDFSSENMKKYIDEFRDTTENVADDVKDGVDNTTRKMGEDMMNMGENGNKTNTIGEFSTPITDSDANRLGNIDLAITRLNGQKIKVGETLSFNEKVGARTYEAGYRDAVIYIDDDKEMGLGGGICQVSTTIYNAAVKAGLEVVERHEHDGDVPYVEDGMDATITKDKDLKIKNNKDYDIIMAVSRDDKNINVTFEKVQN